MAGIMELRDATFADQVFKTEGPTLVEFWAPWCKPCLFLNPVLEEVAGELEGKLKVVKLNIDENPVAATMYGVRSIPTMILFQQENELDTIAGFVAKDELLRRMAAALAQASPSPEREERNEDDTEA